MAACGAVFLFGLGNAFNKKADVPGVTLAFWRAWLGVPVMLAILVASGGRPSRQMFVRSAEAGLSFGIQICLFFTAIHHTSVTNATAIAALQPVLVMAAAWRWMSERFTSREVLFALAALLGVLVVVATGTGSIGGGLEGDLLAAAALVLWAHYYLAVKRARQVLSAYELMAGVLITAALVITPYALLTGADVGAMQAPDWFWCVMIVVVPGAAGHLLNSWSAHYLPVSLLSQLTLGIPVVAVAGAAVLVGETVTSGQVLGIAFTLLMLGLLLRRHLPASDEEIAELPGIAAVEHGVVPADKGIHP
jgi:drug/metabolite transporter (DMT)-like permease